MNNSKNNDANLAKNKIYCNLVYNKTFFFLIIRIEIKKIYIN